MPFDKSKKLYVILAMSTCMVIGMVLCMSVFGLVTAALSNGLNGDSLFSAYLMIVLKNFILAYPLQLLIMGPLVRGFYEICKTKAHSCCLTRKGVSVTPTPFQHIHLSSCRQYLLLSALTQSYVFLTSISPYTLTRSFYTILRYKQFLLHVKSR